MTKSCHVADRRFCRNATPATGWHNSFSDASLYITHSGTSSQCTISIINNVALYGGVATSIVHTVTTRAATFTRCYHPCVCTEHIIIVLNGDVLNGHARAGVKYEVRGGKMRGTDAR